MSDAWRATTIGQCLAESFPGEWGEEPKPGNVVVYRATDIDDECRVVGRGTERRLPAGKLSAKRLQDGDILLEGSGGGPDKPVGRVAYFDSHTCTSPAVCSNFFRTLRPAPDRVDPRFLLRKLAWFYRQAPLLALQQQTTGIVNLKFEEYLASAISVPDSIVEQSKITQILDTLDSAIHETEALIAKLKAVKQGLLHDLLTRGIDANGELRPPQSEAPHLYKQSPLGLIPKAWDACELNDLVDPARGIVYGILMPGYGYPGGIPVVKVKDIVDDAIKLDGLLLTSPQIDREYSRSRLRAGDLLFTIRGTVGRTAIVPGELDGANITQDTARLAVKRTDVRFVRACLSMQAAKSFITTNTLGVAVQGINLRDVRRVPLPLTKPDEAKEIASRLDAATQRVNRETHAVGKLRLAKTGLMDDLLTGRVRVTPLLDD